MCKHTFLDLGYSVVCQHCGLQERVLPLDTYSKYSAPLFRGYDRLQRFKLKVDKLLGFHNGPKCSDPVWEPVSYTHLTLPTICSE